MGLVGDSHRIDWIAFDFLFPLIINTALLKIGKMATVFKVEEEDIQIGTLVMPHEAYYLLDGDCLVKLATQITAR